MRLRYFGSACGESGSYFPHSILKPFLKNKSPLFQAVQVFRPQLSGGGYLNCIHSGYRRNRRVFEERIVFYEESCGHFSGAEAETA